MTIIVPPQPIEAVIANQTITANVQPAQVVSVLVSQPMAITAALTHTPIVASVASIGIAGPPGAMASPEAVAGVSMVAGTPVYISRANGQLYPADNAASVTSFVVGLLTADVVSGFVGSFNRLTLTLSDWTAITGTALLLPGQPYFLSAGGTLSTSVPSAPGTNTRVGEALNSTTLGIFPGILPIVL